MPPVSGGIFLLVKKKLGGNVGHQPIFQMKDAVFKKQLSFFHSLQLKIINQRICRNGLEFVVQGAMFCSQFFDFCTKVKYSMLCFSHIGLSPSRTGGW